MAVVTTASWNIVISLVEMNSKDSTYAPVVVADDVAQGIEENGLSSGT